MVKKIMSLIFLVGMIPFETFAYTTVTTNCDKVPVQENYDSNRVICFIPNSTVVTKLEQKDSLYRIKIDDIEGYINSAYTVEGQKEISTGSLNTSSSSNFTTVTTNCYRVPMYESTAATKVIYFIPNSSTAVTYLGKSGEYYKIEVNGTEGYINRAYTVEGINEIAAEKLSAAQSSTYSVTIPSNATFVEIAALRKQYVRDNGYLYDTSGPIVPANASKVRKTDCSAYVSDVLYYYGKVKNWPAMMNIGRQRSPYFNAIGRRLRNGETNEFFELVPSAAQAAPGDILCYDGHVEIYAGGQVNGKPRVYNCGSTSAIRSSSLITTASRYASKLTCILRVK